MGAVTSGPLELVRDSMTWEELVSEALADSTMLELAVKELAEEVSVSSSALLELAKVSTTLVELVSVVSVI